MPQPLTVAFDSRCWIAILSLAVNRYPLETGGILVGTWSGDCARVTNVVGPGPSANHERRSFEPDQAWQVAEVARLWRISGGQAAYLGDWHTHPDGRPRLSRVDRATAKIIAASAKALCPPPILAVVALADDGRLRPHVEVFLKGQLRPAKLTISDDRQATPETGVGFLPHKPLLT